MMAGNPSSWWSINSMHPHEQSHQEHLSSSSSSQYLYGSNSSISVPDHQSNQEFPRSWSQLLLGGLGNEQPQQQQQERFVSSPFQYKKLENWGDDDQILSPSLRVPIVDVIKQEVAQTSLLYGATTIDNDEFHGNNRPNSSWSQMMPSSSPSSCVTSLSTTLLNFSNSQPDGRNQLPQNSSHELKSSSSGGVPKKPKIQHSTTQTVLKVRKEKLGDRITALHQLVSPFGKTDTASVLSEAIGYIRFLQSQIEALSSPYLGNVSGGGMAHQHQHQCEQQQDRPKDLKSRGLCLVPVSCTQHVGNENGADYWAPALGGGF